MAGNINSERGPQSRFLKTIFEFTPDTETTCQELTSQVFSEISICCSKKRVLGNDFQAAGLKDLKNEKMK